MIMVTIEIWPFGDYHRRRTLGTVELCNDGTGSADVGNYDVTLTNCDPATLSDWDTLVCKVKNYRRQLGAFKLIKDALILAMSEGAKGI